MITILEAKSFSKSQNNSNSLFIRRKELTYTKGNYTKFVAISIYSDETRFNLQGVINYHEICRRNQWR